MFTHTKVCIYSMSDFNDIMNKNCMYIISEYGMKWAIYGRTKNIKRRFCQYLEIEKDALTFKYPVKITLYFGTNNEVMNLETDVKRQLRKNKYDYLFVNNERGNQVEFIPNKYVGKLVSLINNHIKIENRLEY